MKNKTIMTRFEKQKNRSKSKSCEINRFLTIIIVTMLFSILCGACTNKNQNEVEMVIDYLVTANMKIPEASFHIVSTAYNISIDAWKSDTTLMSEYTNGKNVYDHITLRLIKDREVIHGFGPSGQLVVAGSYAEKWATTCVEAQLAIRDNWWFRAMRLMRMIIGRELPQKPENIKLRALYGNGKIDSNNINDLVDNGWLSDDVKMLGGIATSLMRTYPDESPAKIRFHCNIDNYTFYVPSPLLVVK